MISGLKEALVISLNTVKQLVKGDGHLQDYMVVGYFFAAGLALGCLL